MRVVYIFRFSSLAGDRFQGEILCRELDAIPLNCSTIMGGRSGALAIPSKNFGEIYYPVNYIAVALEQLSPDVLFVHTISTDVVGEIGSLVRKYPTCLRLGVNFEEFILTPQIRDATALILSFLGIVDVVIAPSKFVERGLRALGVRDVVHIPTAVDASKFRETDPDGNRLLMCGRLSVIKNFLIPILAMKKVLRKVPDAKLDVLGEGNLMATYEHLITVLGLSDHVKLLGFQKPGEYYSSAKVFLAPSISENMSMTVVEALTSGVPVVASDIGGHRAGKSITYVEHDDIDGFADRMIQLLTDQELWERKHRMALKDARKYDVKVVAKKYKKLFRRLVKLKRYKTKSLQEYMSRQDPRVTERLRGLGVTVEGSM